MPKKLSIRVDNELQQQIHHDHNDGEFYQELLKLNPINQTYLEEYQKLSADSDWIDSFEDVTYPNPDTPGFIRENAVIKYK